MILAQCARTLEERFGDHRKEFRRIGGAVVVEKSVVARLGGFTQRVELRAHYPRPRAIVAVVLQRRRPVAAPILEIELVGELVEHQVHSVVRLRRAAMDRIPRQDQRAKLVAGVSEAMLATFLPNAAADVALFVGDVFGWINENRRQLRVVIGLAMQQQQARLSRDGNTDLVGEHEPAASLEMFFRQKVLGVAEQLGLVFRSKAMEDGEVAFENLPPGLGGGASPQIGATAGFKELERHTLE